MMRKFLLLALVTATLPLYGVEEMQFITHLGTDTSINSQSYGAFGIVEQVDPTDASGNISQLQVCHLSFGELQNGVNHFVNQKGTITVQGEEAPHINTLNLSDWTTLWSQDEGEYRVGNKLNGSIAPNQGLEVYKGGVLEGGALYAEKISFPRYQNDQNAYTTMNKKTDLRPMGSKLRVDNTLTINLKPGSSGTKYVLKASGAKTNNLRYGTDPSAQSYFESPESSGEAKWRYNGASKWYLVK